MQKLTLEDLEYQLDPNVSADANLQHLLHVFEGYASASDDNPYPRDSARWWSWFTGYGLRSPGDHGEDVDENDIEDRIPARDGFGRKCSILVWKNTTKDGEFCPRCDFAHYDECEDRNEHDSRIGKRHLKKGKKGNKKEAKSGDS